MVVGDGQQVDIPVLVVKCDAVTQEDRLSALMVERVQAFRLRD